MCACMCVYAHSVGVGRLGRCPKPQRPLIAPPSRGTPGGLALGSSGLLCLLSSRVRWGLCWVRLLPSGLLSHGRRPLPCGPRVVVLPILQMERQLQRGKACVAGASGHPADPRGPEQTHAGGHPGRRETGGGTDAVPGHRQGHGPLSCCVELGWGRRTSWRRWCSCWVVGGQRRSCRGSREGECPQGPN